VPTLLTAAITRRAPLLAGGSTDACRLVDGPGDGLPGLFIDTFAGRRLIATRDAPPAPDLLEELTPTRSPLYHKRLDHHEHEPPVHFAGPRQDEPFLIRENGVAFEVSFQAGYSQGIFLDQRDNRVEVRRRAAAGTTLLNTFAYTGAFSVVAALAGAVTTTLDLSQSCLAWTRRNFTHNHLDPAGHHFCKGDTLHWLARFAQQGRRFDAIVLDPPTFSRDHRGRVFRVESDYTRLVELALACLADAGWLLCCTNCRQLAAPAFARMIRAASARPLDLTSTPMPPDFPAEPYLKSLWVRR
jgi:23S rRNA (cytosine1962-C5)-methyltransferase